MNNLMWPCSHLFWPLLFHSMALSNGYNYNLIWLLKITKRPQTNIGHLVSLFHSCFMKQQVFQAWWVTILFMPALKWGNFTNFINFDNLLRKKWAPFFVPLCPNVAILWLTKGKYLARMRRLDLRPWQFLQNRMV